MARRQRWKPGTQGELRRLKNDLAAREKSTHGLEFKAEGSGNEQALLDYWGPKMDHPGSFAECVDALSGKDGIDDPEALCAWIHHESTGKWPSEKKGAAVAVAAGLAASGAFDEGLHPRDQDGKFTFAGGGGGGEGGGDSTHGNQAAPDARFAVDHSKFTDRERNVVVRALSRAGDITKPVIEKFQSGQHLTRDDLVNIHNTLNNLLNSDEKVGLREQFAATGVRAALHDIGVGTAADREGKPKKALDDSDLSSKFEEDAHPRDEHGRFASGGGAASGDNVDRSYFAATAPLGLRRDAAVRAQELARIDQVLARADVGQHAADDLRSAGFNARMVPIAPSEQPGVGGTGRVPVPTGRVTVERGDMTPVEHFTEVARAAAHLESVGYDTQLRRLGDDAYVDVAPRRSKGDMEEDIDHKSLTGLGYKMVDEDEGIVETIVSVTGLEDRVKDIIEPGAYAKTLAKRTPKGVWSHDWDVPVAKTLGAPVELMPGDPRLPAETKDGEPWPREAGALLVRTQFNRNTTAGEDAFQNVKFFGLDQEWSIGYKVPSGKSYVDKKTGIRHIKEMDLYEYSPVLFGAMPHATTMSVKADADSGHDYKGNGGPCGICGEGPKSGKHRGMTGEDDEDGDEKGFTPGEALRLWLAEAKDDGDLDSISFDEIYNELKASLNLGPSLPDAASTAAASTATVLEHIDAASPDYDLLARAVAQLAVVANGGTADEAPTTTMFAGNAATRIATATRGEAQTDALQAAVALRAITDAMSAANSTEAGMKTDKEDIDEKASAFNAGSRDPVSSSEGQAPAHFVATSVPNSTTTGATNGSFVARSESTAPFNEFGANSPTGSGQLEGDNQSAVRGGAPGEAPAGSDFVNFAHRYVDDGRGRCARCGRALGTDLHTGWSGDGGFSIGKATDIAGVERKVDTPLHGSWEQTQRALCDAVNAGFKNAGALEATYEDTILVSAADTYFSVPWSRDDEDKIVLGEPTEVKLNTVLSAQVDPKEIADILAEMKVGRVISQRNRDKLMQAHGHLSDVIASAEVRGNDDEKSVYDSLDEIPDDLAADLLEMEHLRYT